MYFLISLSCLPKLYGVGQWQVCSYSVKTFFLRNPDVHYLVHKDPPLSSPSHPPRFIYLTTTCEEHTLWSAWLFTFLRPVTISSILGPDACLITVLLTMFDICYLLGIFRLLNYLTVWPRLVCLLKTWNALPLNPLMKTVHSDKSSLIFWHIQSDSGKNSQHHWSSSTISNDSNSSDGLSCKGILIVRNTFVSGSLVSNALMTWRESKHRDHFKISFS
jgi:hypothetical protein